MKKIASKKLAENDYCLEYDSWVRMRWVGLEYLPVPMQYIYHKNQPCSYMYHHIWILWVWEKNMEMLGVSYVSNERLFYGSSSCA